MDTEKQRLIDRMLEVLDDMFNILSPTLSVDRLPTDITVAQLRVLLALRSTGPSPMNLIANAAGVVPSTATGIVDNLVAKGLVMREDDPNDRRRVVCRLTPEGKEMANGVWSWGREQIRNILEFLTSEQLREACKTAEAFRDSASEYIE